MQLVENVNVHTKNAVDKGRIFKKVVVVVVGSYRNPVKIA